jgi:hypothetical protein
MHNDPTGTSCSAYYEAIRDAADALSHVRAEEDAYRITPLEVCAERVGLLERHLEECRRLRREHIGGS